MPKPAPIDPEYWTAAAEVTLFWRVEWIAPED